MQLKRNSVFILLTLIILNAAIAARLPYLEGTDGEIRIRADGSIDPPTTAISTADGRTYRFVNDISSSLVVERNNILIDGEGHTIQGTQGEDTKGIALIGRSNVTIKSISVRAFRYNIYLQNSSSCKITDCTVSENATTGILLDGFSTYNNITLNRIFFNWNNGIRLSDSSDFNTICDNNFTENFVAVTVSKSANNILMRNNITMNHWGISIESSFNTTLSSNFILNGYRDMSGIYIASSTNNLIKGNRISNSSDGLVLLWSSYNVIIQNTITQNYYGGMYFRDCSNNSIYENMVSDNEGGCGISAIYSSNNTIYHNGFVNNGPRVLGESADYVNAWDNGYPDGGNYWTSYVNPDVLRGEDQNEVGSDGIIDEPFVMDAKNIDRFPLTKPYSGLYDVGIRVALSRTIVAEGYNITVKMNVTAINYGHRTESLNFRFQTHGTDFEADLSVESRSSEIFTFMLDTTGLLKGNYSIEVLIDVVQNETDISDNTYESYVLITSLGDIAPEYGSVDIFDITKIALAFGSRVGESNWNPNSDINDDGVIDIFDMVVVAAHFGQVS